MTSAVARAYNSGLGAEPPAGSRGRAGGRGQSPPEAEAFLAFSRSMEVANLPIFQNLGNTKTSDIYVIFAKNHGWPRNWGGGWSKRPSPSLGLKPPLQSTKSSLNLQCNKCGNRVNAVKSQSIRHSIVLITQTLK